LQRNAFHGAIHFRVFLRQRQRRRLERGIDEMGCISQRCCGLRALRGIRQVDRHMARAVEIARLAPRQCDDVSAAGPANAAMRHFLPAPSRLRSLPFCQPLQYADADRRFH
jgi:hypothetical protein